MRVFLFLRSVKKMFVLWLHFLDRALWPVAQGISHYEDSLPDWQPIRITPLSSLLTPWHETDLNVTKIIRGMHSQDFLVLSVYFYLFIFFISLTSAADCDVKTPKFAPINRRYESCVRNHTWRIPHPQFKPQESQRAALSVSVHDKCSAVPRPRSAATPSQPDR